MSKREGLAATFLAHLHEKDFDQAKAMLSDTVALTVPQVPTPIQGKDALIMALKMASDSGQGMDMVGFSKPVEQPDGAINVAGRAPGGLVWFVAWVVRKAKKVAVTLRFGEGDVIEAMEVVLT